jgi:hypothetical protein
MHLRRLVLVRRAIHTLDADSSQLLLSTFRMEFYRDEG